MTQAATKTIWFTPNDFGYIKCPSGRSKRKSLNRSCPRAVVQDRMVSRTRIWRRAMRNKLAAISFAVVVVLAVSVPLFAHHGYAAYDTERKVTLKGTVTRWIWSNPHCMIQLDVSDDSGHVVRWITETENPTTMTRNGWTDKSIKVGEQVTVIALPVKNGNPAGRILEVVLSNGERLAGRVNPATQVKPDDSPRPCRAGNER